MITDPYKAMMDKAKKDAQDLLDDYSRYGVFVPVNGSELSPVTIINRGDRLLNTYPYIIIGITILHYRASLVVQW